MKLRSTRLPQHRIIMLVVLCIALTLVSSLRVFQYQIVDGDEYLISAMSGTTTKISIPAARGDIVDADGNVLAGSKASFDVTLNFLLMEHTGKLNVNDEAANALIYRLIRTFEELGQEWNDDLPISEKSPYTFAEDASESAIKRLKKRVDVNEYATAENCIDWLFRECGIKKFRDSDGNCTHCGDPFDECAYKEYSEEYARKIAGVRYSMLAKDFSAYNSEYTFAKDVSIQTVALIRELSEEFIGATIKETSVRTYLSGDVAPQIIGTVSPMYDDEYETIYRKKFPDEPGKQYSRDDLVGRSGIEAAFEDDLRGTSGTMTIRQNSQGDIISVQETSAPIAGKTVQLTLDYSMTKRIQTQLIDYIAWYNSINSGRDTVNASVVVLDAKNGGVLSSISFPYYDINDALENYSEVANREGSPLVNRALNGLYRPGSTFKCIVAAAGFQEGYINKDYTCYCNGDYYTYYAPWLPNCVGTGHFGGANLNCATALHFSCNSFFYDLGRIMGIDTVGQYARYFGLGVDTGLEVSTQIGHMSSKNDANWEVGNTIQASIGQMNTTVTPLQMAVEAMTIANRGTRFETHLLDSLLDENGNTLESYETTIASEFKMTDEAYEEISKGMKLVAGNLYAPYQVNDLGYEVYIKTGTPQATSTRTHHCIIAYITKDGEPEIAVSIMQEDGAACQRFLRQIILAYDMEKYPEKYANIEEYVPGITVEEPAEEEGLENPVEPTE